MRTLQNVQGGNCLPGTILSLDESPDDCLTAVCYTGLNYETRNQKRRLAMSRLLDTRLTRRQSLLALTYAAAFGPLALAGCGGGSKGVAVANGTTGKSVPGQATLPAGIAGRAAQMRLYTGVGDSSLAADGKFTVNT